MRYLTRQAALAVARVACRDKGHRISVFLPQKDGSYRSHCRVCGAEATVSKTRKWGVDGAAVHNRCTKGEV